MDSDAGQKQQQTIASTEQDTPAVSNSVALIVYEKNTYFIPHQTSTIKVFSA